MSAKFRLEKVTGVVALSYLVLIPAAAVWGYQKIHAVEADLDQVWDKVMPPGTDPVSSMSSMEKFREYFKR